MKPILEIQNISKKFRINHETQPYLSLRDTVVNFFSSPLRRSGGAEDFWALRDVSFHVNAGETIGIVGKNGAGKSTLLKILSKITPPTSGKIISRGRIASLLEVGTGFHPELSGRENVFMNGSILGMRKNEIQKNFDAIVDFAGVEKFIDTPLKHYSSGMQLRLAFAVAAFLENEILIIDEVLAVGDAEFQKKCLGKMQDVSKSGRTVLFVSHNMSAVMELCRKAILLQQGKLELKGNTNEVIETYIKQYQTKKSIASFGRENKEVYLSDFHVHGVSSDLNASVFPDKDCFFTLNIVASKAIQNIHIGIGINDQMNSRVLTLYTKHLGIKFNLTEGLNTIQCKIANLPLKPASYNLHVLIGSDYETYDYHADAAEMEVAVNSFYYKEIPEQSQGSFIIKQEWSTI